MTVMRWLRGPASHRRVVVEAAALLPVVRLGLSMLPYTLVERRLARWAKARPVRSATGEDPIARVTSAVDGVGRRLPGISCLSRALATHAMLVRRGIPAVVRLGARPRSNARRSLDAHAWVETGGRVVMGDVPWLAEYQQFESISTRLSHRLAPVIRGERVAWADLATTPERLLEYCDEEDLSSLVHHALGSLGDDWPAAARDGLAERARAEAAIEMVRRAELRRVIDALGARGVRAVLFKGTALAYTRYAEPWLRPRADTDLLIRRDDRAASRDTLEALGYTLTPAGAGDLVFRQFELQRCDEHGVAHALDVHWQISNQERFARLFDDDEVWDRSEPVPALGRHARAAGAADALLISCVHPVMHHRDEERLIWLYDTHVIASAMDATAWSAFTALASAKAIAAVCAHGLALAHARLGAPLPPRVRADLDSAARRPEPSAEYLAPHRGWRDEVASNLRALPDWRSRLRLLGEMAFPPPAYVRRVYSVDRSALGWLLLPALYAHRAVRGVWRNAGGPPAQSRL
jgi:Uncharacterised nucleotidyltransferase/Transglutaminase-like superfamily